MSITEQICEHIVASSYDDLTQVAIDRAKIRILDSIGVIAAGAYAPGCDAMYDMVSRWGGAQEASVLVHGIKIPAHNAAMMNSLMMRSYDFEAIEAEGKNQTSSAAHISGTSVPVTLAVAEAQHTSGKDLLTALVLGDDFASRLGAASGFDVYGGWDNTGTVNGLGSTAIAGKLLGLDVDQMVDALGIVENQLSGVIDNIIDKTLAFKLPMAVTARNAIFSAELAKGGFSAMKDAIAGPHGFFKMYCGDPKLDVLMDDLGVVYYADCVVKPWAACRATHPSINACLNIIEQNDVNLDDIEAIVIHATPRTCAGFVGQPFEIGPIPQVSGAFSIRFTAANAILRGTVRPEHYALEMMEEPAMQMLLDKIDLVPTLDANQYQTSEVEIKMKDGTVFFSRCDVPKGEIYKSPMSSQEIIDKFYANVEFSGAIKRGAADKVLEIVNGLETAENLDSMFALLKK
ncbi:MAG: MmgE/PrpD family protein [Actinobacteria bacterium]|nr:MmgE/PrpD family protein [Actinomycetota bacterium]